MRTQVRQRPPILQQNWSPNDFSHLGYEGDAAEPEQDNDSVVKDQPPGYGNVEDLRPVNAEIQLGKLAINLLNDPNEASAAGPLEDADDASDPAAATDEADPSASGRQAAAEALKQFDGAHTRIGGWEHSADGIMQAFRDLAWATTMEQFKETREALFAQFQEQQGSCLYFFSTSLLPTYLHTYRYP